MRKTITFTDFCDAFQRSDRANQFSYEGKRALFDMLEELDPEYELDVIELCCTYTEYDSLEEFLDNYGGSDEITSIDDIENYTFLIRTGDPDKFIIQNY